MKPEPSIKNTIIKVTVLGGSGQIKESVREASRGEGIIAPQEQQDAPSLKDRRIFVVLNPVSGEGKGKEFAERLPELWQSKQFTVYETSGDETLAQVVQDALADGYEMVAAIGGDGTVSEVADGLVNEEIPLLIIPAGTGNALAKELNIPLQMEAASRLALEGAEIRKLDAVCVQDRCFFLQLGAGLESVTMKKTSRAAKSSWGILAYLWTAVREGVDWQPHRFTLQIDGETHTVRAAEIVVANSATLGILSIEWGDHISPEDGVIHVGAIRARTIVDYVRSLMALMQEDADKTPLIRYFEARHSLKIESERPLPVHGDGEYLKDTPVTAHVKRAALTVVTPKEKNKE